MGRGFLPDTVVDMVILFKLLLAVGTGFVIFALL